MRDPLDEITTKIEEATDYLHQRREAEARLKLALQVAGIGMWDWEIASNKLIWDERMSDLFDCCHDCEKTYETFISKVVPEDRERIQEAVDHSLRTGEPYEEDYTILWKDGSRHKIHARGMRYPETGNPEKLIGVCMEIRDRRPL